MGPLPPRPLRILHGGGPRFPREAGDFRPRSAIAKSSASPETPVAAGSAVPRGIRDREILSLPRDPFGGRFSRPSGARKKSIS
eukprot:gene16558-biopygen20295